ncbi:MAG: hypothetical protein LBU46_05225 [Candidatus Accumulibacter sp.]|jgi:hypothetical protein|nr:hypothetical protein [Accumulibacter sp.]
MRVKIFALPLAMLPLIAQAKEQLSCDDHFGANLQVITEQMTFRDGDTTADLKGDFNGDGLEDRVIVLKVDKTVQFNESVTVSDTPLTWSSVRKPEIQFVNVSKVLYPAKEAIALGIIQSDLSGKTCKKYVIYNAVPASKVKQFNVGVVHAQSVEYVFYQKNASQKLSYDAILLQYDLDGPLDATLVYWNNKKYIFDSKFSFPEDADPPEPE